MRALLLLSLVVLAGPALGAEDYAGPKPGEAAPDFTLKAHDGKDVKLSSLRGGYVVLEWVNPGCPFVKRHYDAGTMKRLAEKFGKKVTWLAVNSSHFVTVADNAAFVKERGLPYRVLDDHTGATGRAYGARTTPHMYIVGPDGKLVYRGAIDDDPYGEKPAPLNYVEQVLSAALEGKPAPTTWQKPYGCTVKYAK